MVESLPQEVRDFVQSEVANGRYDSEAEVVEAALLMMRDRATRLQEFRRRIVSDDVDQMLTTA